MNETGSSSTQGALFAEPNVTPPTSTRARLIHCVGLLALLLPAWAVYSTGLYAGEFWWTDEARHAMNGVFMLDLIRDQPWSSPLEYALRYFAQYPALALNWYPPGFYVVEAFFLWAFGISEFSGHLTSLAFLVVGLILYYRWASSIWGIPVAVIAGLIVCCSPQSVIWGRALMLDLPATAMAMISIFVFDRYLKRPDVRGATLLGISVLVMLLVKQTTIFVLPVLVAYPLLTRQGAVLIRRESLIPLALTLLALAFLFVHAVKFGGTGVAATVGDLNVGQGGKAPLVSLARWTLFGVTLLRAYGWPFMIAVLIGVGVAWASAKRRPEDAILLLWVLSWYVTSTLLFAVPGNSPRYTIYAMPALALLAARSVDLVSWKAYRYSVLTLLAAYAGILVHSAISTPPGYVQGYQEAARTVLQSPVRGTVLFAGKHDGNFVLHMRAGDPERRRVILRGDKTLVTMSVTKYFGIQSHVRSEADVLDLLKADSVAWIVVDRPNITGVEEFELLWNVLQGPEFRLERRIAVQTNLPEYKNSTIELYRRLEMTDSGTAPLSVTIPVLGRDIKFDL